MSRRFTVAVYLLLVFLSGALVGAFGYRLYSVNVVASSRQPRSAEEYRRSYVEMMTSRLQLSAEQVENLEKIMDGTRQRYHEIYGRFRPELKAIETAQYEQIRAMLNETQKAEYEKIRAEREARRKQNRHRKAPPHPR